MNLHQIGNDNDESRAAPSTKRKDEAITKEFIAFLEKVIGVVVAFVGIIATFMWKDRLYLPASFATAASLILLCYVAYIHYYHNVIFNNKISAFHAVIFASSSSLFFGVSSGIYFSPTQQTERLHFERKTLIMKEPSSKKTESAFLAVQSPYYRPHASPIHVLMNLSITNVQITTSQIVAYSLSYSDDGGRTWDKLCPVRLDGRTLYLAYDIDKAVEISTSNFLENNLLEKELQPHSRISGWSAWQCSSIECNFKLLKITVRDAEGNKTSGIIDQSDAASYENASGSELIIPPGSTKADLSSAVFELEPNCR